MNIWSHLSRTYEEDNLVHIDAWLTADDNENGSVIATVNKSTGEIDYRDDRAKKDHYAQLVIKEILAEL